MTEIVLDHAPFTPFDHPRTAGPPGLSPMDPADWIVVHGDYAAQMRYRAEILARHPDVVLAMSPVARDAADELLAEILAHLTARPDFQVAGDRVTRPDGAVVTVDPACPLETLNRLTAEDWCLMLADPDCGEYRLQAAILCFPARWLLAEKMGHPLTVIHDPVPEYDATLARRVNRVFEALRVGRPIVRANWIIHTDPELYLPIGRETKRVARTRGDGPLYLRTERQTLVRLPRTEAVVFGIKTSVTPVAALDPATLGVLTDAFAHKLEVETADGDSADDRRRTLARLRELAGQDAAGSRSSRPEDQTGGSPHVPRHV